MSFDAIVFEAVRAARVAVERAITAARNTITSHVTTESTAVKTHVTNAKTEIVAAVNNARIKSIQRGRITGTFGPSAPATATIATVNPSRSQLRAITSYAYYYVAGDGPRETSVPITLTANAVVVTPSTNNTVIDVSWEVTEWY